MACSRPVTAVMEANRTARRSTSPWADRRTGGRADRRSASTLRRLDLSLISESHWRLVTYHETGPTLDQPHRLLWYAQPRQLQHDVRQQPMLHFQHARGERLRRVVRTDGHGPLRDDRTPVILLVHVVDGRSRERGAAREHGLVDAAAV